MSSWQRGVVADIAAPVRNALVGGPFGSDLTSRDYVPAGIPVIRGANLGVGRWVGGDFVYVSEAKADSLSANCASPGDLVFTQRGTLGQVALAPGDGPQRYLVSQSQMKLTVDKTKADPLFLYYYFESPATQDYIKQHAIQTGVPHINLGILRAMPVPLPPLEDQRRIAATLGALDDRIEFNRRVAALVPELVRARVTDAMGTGSVRAPVSSLAAFVNGGAYTNGASGKGRIVIRIAELNGGPGGSTIYNDIDVPDDKTARWGDILMSWSGSLGVYRWAGNEAIINQHIFKVIPHEYPVWLVFDRVDAVIDIFQGIAKDKATTMGHIQRGHLDSTLVDLPMADAINELDLALGPLWDRLLLAEREAVTLAALRDALMPELFSGRVRVAENDVG